MVVAADRADHGPAVELGEHQVEDDERGPVALDGFEGGWTVRGGHDREAVALEVGAHQTDDLGVVVDDEDRSIGERLGRLGRHRKHGRGVTVGGSRDTLVTPADLFVVAALLCQTSMWCALGLSLCPVDAVRGPSVPATSVERSSSRRIAPPFHVEGALDGRLAGNRVERLAAALDSTEQMF